MSLVQTLKHEVVNLQILSPIKYRKSVFSYEWHKFHDGRKNKWNPRGSDSTSISMVRTALHRWISALLGWSNIKCKWVSFFVLRICLTGFGTHVSLGYMSWPIHRIVRKNNYLVAQMKTLQLLIPVYRNEAEFFSSIFFSLDISQVAVEQLAYWKRHHSLGKQIAEYFKKFIHRDINENTWSLQNGRSSCSRQKNGESGKSAATWHTVCLYCNVLH